MPAVAGSYTVLAHYYATHASSGLEIPVDCDVVVENGGNVLYTGARTLTAQNQVWNVGDVTHSGGVPTFTLLDTIFTTTPLFAPLPGK